MRSTPNRILVSIAILITVLLTFFVGAFSSIYTTQGGRSWVLAARDRAVAHIPDLPLISKDSIGGVFGVSDPKFPDNIETLRYNLITSKNYSIKGQFQLTQDSSSNIYAVDRNNGDFFELFDEKSNSLENIFSAINLYEGHKSRAFRITDLHYFKSTFFINSVLITNRGQEECGSAYSFEIVDKEIINFNRFLKTPCIQDRKNPAMWGGRFANSDSSLYLSIGEQRYDRSGFPKLSTMATKERENLDSIFGCVLKFEWPNRQYQRYTCGHRNAQGLSYSTRNMTLYESEHGPQGGDEVNALVKGKNYGWPSVSLGGAYGWPLAGPESEKKKINFDVSVTNTQYEKQLATYGFKRGTHAGFPPPLMSWIPSVGASAILEIPEKPGFSEWSGDLVVGMMAEMSIHRLRVNENRIILDEKIPLGFRVRDMLIGADNLLYISTDEDQLVTLKFQSKN